MTMVSWLTLESSSKQTMQCSKVFEKEKNEHCLIFRNAVLSVRGYKLIKINTDKSE